MKRARPHSAPRRPEDYVEALEARTRRRIGGGLLALHRRGETRLGAGPWKVVLGCFAGLAGLGLLRWLARRGGGAETGAHAGLVGRIGPWLLR
jgi:hypothetical protein